MQAVLCIVHCNKVSKPVKGKYLLLCINSITILIYFNHVFKSFKSLNIENYKFREIFQKGVLKYFKIFMKFLIFQSEIFHHASLDPTASPPEGHEETSGQ